MQIPPVSISSNDLTTSLSMANNQQVIGNLLEAHMFDIFSEFNIINWPNGPQHFPDIKLDDFMIDIKSSDISNHPNFIKGNCSPAFPISIIQSKQIFNTYIFYIWYVQTNNGIEIKECELLPAWTLCCRYRGFYGGFYGGFGKDDIAFVRLRQNNGKVKLEAFDYDASLEYDEAFKYFNTAEIEW